MSNLHDLYHCDEDGIIFILYVFTYIELNAYFYIFGILSKFRLVTFKKLKPSFFLTKKYFLIFFKSEKWHLEKSPLLVTQKSDHSEKVTLKKSNLEKWHS